MLKSPHLQPAISARDSHFEESTKLEALNEDLAAAETAAAMAPAASQHTFPPAALDAQLHSIPSRIMNEDNADLSIDDVPFASSSAHPLPCLPDHAALPHRSNRLHDDDVVDIGATQTLEPKVPAAPKQRHKKSASSSKSDMHHFNKKRTFSLKEHMKSSDPHPSDEESAHSFKWLIIKRPTYFSAAQVESQDPLPSPKYTFVDLMNAAPHLAATVQRNVAISMASDLLEKASDAKSNPTPAIKSSGAITGSTKANSAKAHTAKVPDPPPKGVEKAASAPVLDALGYVKAPGQPPANAKLEPHIPPKKRKSKFSKDATGPISRAPNALSSNAGVPQAGSVGKDRAIPKAPLSSSINLKLSKKLVHSATHVYIANFISSKKKAEEHQKKAQEKQYQSQLRQQQQQQIVQQNQLQQQQQIQQQLQNQQQMMQLFQRSQHDQALQHQDAYLSHTGASMAQTFNPVASSGSSAKAQRSKNTTQPPPPPAGAGGSYPNLSYVMMPPAAGQRAYTSSANMGFPPPAYNSHAQLHAQAQYHNQLLAMQQMTQMSSINQQHQYGRPLPPSRHPTQTASGMPFASMGYPASPYLYGPSQGMPAGVAVAARPQVDFNAARQQHTLQDHMKILQQSEQNRLQNQMPSQMRQQLIVPHDQNPRVAHQAQRLAPNPPQLPPSSASAQGSHAAIAHQVINIDE